MNFSCIVQQTSHKKMKKELFKQHLSRLQLFQIEFVQVRKFKKYNSLDPQGRLFSSNCCEQLLSNKITINIKQPYILGGPRKSITFKNVDKRINKMFN